MCISEGTIPTVNAEFMSDCLFAFECSIGSFELHSGSIVNKPTHSVEVALFKLSSANLFTITLNQPMGTIFII